MDTIHIGLVDDVDIADAPAPVGLALLSLNGAVLRLALAENDYQAQRTGHGYDVALRALVDEIDRPTRLRAVR